MATDLNGYYGEMNYNRIGQVYMATHTRGDLRLPYMHRSFISFSFGEKWIEDFDLIATTADRMKKKLSADFHDVTTSYEVIDGQFYWGTYYDTNNFTFTLSTDGITQEKLDAFKNWFKPGISRELILSEHPNRAILARVATPPEMEMLPFEEKVFVHINNEDYETSTTLYKGNITLNLITDMPYWYGKANVLAKEGEDEEWYDKWTNANNNEIFIYDDKDALKIMLEDHIPAVTMLREDVILGGGLRYSYNEENSKIEYAIIEEAMLENEQKAIESTTDPIILQPNESAYLYYAGTAPEKLNFKFSTVNIPLNTNFSFSLSRNSFQTIDFSYPKIYRDCAKIKELCDKIINQEITDIDEAYIIGRSVLTNSSIKIIFCNILNQIKVGDTLEDFNIEIGENSFSFDFRRNKNEGTFNIHYTAQYSGSVLSEQKEIKEEISDMIMSAPLILEERNKFSNNGLIEQSSCYQFTNESSVPVTISFSYQNRYY